MTTDNDKLERRFFRYVWKYSKPQQIWILLIVALSMPTYFFAFDIPKQIVNGPIQGRGYETIDATSPVLPLSISNPIGEGQWTLFEGFQMGRIDALITLSFTFLGLVAINGIFKFYINTYKGRLGERMLRRLRFQLVDRVLRFPMKQYRRVRSSEIATMIKDEVEPLGGFIGEAFAQPAFLVGQAFTALLFILLQSWVLGSIAVAILLVQGFLIPRLRARLRELARQRQLTARELSGRVSEIVDGAADIRLNDGTNFQRSDISDRLATIFFIRFDFFQWKFMVKFINNFLAQVTPFVFYLGGGYLAIRGELNIGQLVAVIAAYKDLPGPIKELIDWDYRRLDVQVKYDQVMSQFDINPVEPSESQIVRLETAPPLDGSFEFKLVSAQDDSGQTIVEDLSVSLDLEERIAAIGPTGAGAEAMANLLARLNDPSEGAVRLNGIKLAEQPEWHLGRRIGYSGAEPFFPQATVLDTILSGIKNGPMKPAPEGKAMSLLMKREAKASGNPLLERHADWVNYKAAGCDSLEELDARIQEVLATVGLHEDIYAFGLLTKPNMSDGEEETTKILEARAIFSRKLKESDNAEDVALFDENAFNPHMNIIQNFVFGDITDASLANSDPTKSTVLMEFLVHQKLDEILYEIGREAADTIVDLFEDVSGNMRLLERLDLVAPEELPTYADHVRKSEGIKFEEVDATIKSAFLRVAFNYIEPKHRLGLITEEIKDKLVNTRKAFKEKFEEEYKGIFSFYRANAVNPMATLQDNITFGRIVDERSGASERVKILLRLVLKELNLSDDIIERGLNYDIGSGGRRVSLPQRQQLSLARAIIKNPDFLIVNRGLSALDQAATRKIMENVIRLSNSNVQSFGIFWVAAVESHVELFDRVLKFSKGRLEDDQRNKPISADASKEITS